MIHFQCYAVIPDDEKRRQLASKLRHHNISFREGREQVSVETELVSYKSVEKLIGYFEAAEPIEKGFSIVVDNVEIHLVS